MHRLAILSLVLFTQLTGCSGDRVAENKDKRESLAAPWWESVPAIVIDGSEFYGKPCSVSRVSDKAGVKSETVIFTVPGRLLTYCADSKPDKNYLEYDGNHIVLYVDRQTAGAGSKTGERYRSENFTDWEEYIGITWVDGKEYEAWRKLGSTSSKADSRKKVVRE